MKRLIIAVSAVFIFIASMIMVLAFFQQNLHEENLVSNRIGLILNGKKNDLSWCQSHFEGLKIAADAYGMEIIVKESVRSDECYESIKELIDSGCSLIVSTSFEFEKFMFKASEEYPEVNFLQANGFRSSRNYAGFFGRMYQMRYLAGIVAAKKSKTGQLGFVGAMPDYEINRAINAFALGAQSINPNIKVHVVFTDSWNDDKAAEESTGRLLSVYPGIDVITAHVNSQRVLQIAEERKIWSIGSSYDARTCYPSTYLTAPVWHWDFFYSDVLQEISTGKFKGSCRWYGEETGIMGLSPLSDEAAPGTKKAVDDAKAKIEKGTFDVFFGPVYDNRGNLRVPEGENISDEVLLHDLYWYVKGVDVL